MYEKQFIFIACDHCHHSSGFEGRNPGTCSHCGQKLSGKMWLTVSSDQQNWIYTFSSTYLRMGEINLIIKNLEKVLQNVPQNLAFYFEQSMTLDSSMISLILKAVKSLGNEGIVYIINPDSNFLNSLKLSHIDKVTRILPDIKSFFQETS